MDHRCKLLTSTPKNRNGSSYREGDDEPCESACLSFIHDHKSDTIRGVLYKKIKIEEPRPFPPNLQTGSAPAKVKCIRRDPGNREPLRGVMVNGALHLETIRRSTYDPNNSGLGFMELTFDLEKVVDRTRFSEVEKMRRKNDQKDYAVKTITVSGGAAVISSSDRRTECAFCLLLKHENLVQTFDVIQQNGFFHLIMEYCVIDLGKFLLRDEAETFGEPNSCDLICVMLRTLHFLHENNVVHMDVKPPNIMLSAAGVWKLGDFGLMRSTCMLGDGKIDIQDGDSLYLPPECVHGNFGHHCDLFSMGLVFVETMLHADLPTSGNPETNYQYHFIRVSQNLDWLSKPMEKKGYSKEIFELTADMIKPKFDERPSATVLCTRENVKKRIERRKAEYGTRMTAEKLTKVLTDAREEDRKATKQFVSRKEKENAGDFSESIPEEERGKVLTVEEVQGKTGLKRTPDETQDPTRPKHFATEPRNIGESRRWLSPSTPHIANPNFLREGPYYSSRSDLSTSPIAPSPPFREARQRRLVFSDSPETDQPDHRTGTPNRSPEVKNLLGNFNDLDAPNLLVSPIQALPRDDDSIEGVGFGSVDSEYGNSFSFGLSPRRNLHEVSFSESSATQTCEEQMSKNSMDLHNPLGYDINILGSPIMPLKQNGHDDLKNGLCSCSASQFHNSEQSDVPVHNGTEDMELD